MAAEWKKVLVSGSDITVAGITSSQVPAGTGTDNVVVLGANGEFKQVTQASIQGVTTANFDISGSTGNVEFDATAHTLAFSGSNDATATVGQSGTITTVTINLPDGTVSGSSQISIAQTNGYSTFSSSLAADIATNATNIASNDADITALQNDIIALEASSSQLIDASESIASFIGTANTDLTSLNTSVAALNDFSSSVVTADQTSSFVISSSVVGTANEIEVTSTEAGNVTIGLPTDVTIGGLLEAGNINIVAQNVNEAGAAIISGSTIFGNDIANTHQFTGSVQITGSLEVSQSSGDSVIFRHLSTDDDAVVSDIVVRNGTTNKLGLGGSALRLQISGAFDEVSASIASDLANLSSQTTTDNSTDITNLQTISSSLLASSSVGIRFEDGNSGRSIALGRTASFVATGDGLTVDVNTDAANVTTVNYVINPTTLGGAIGAFSESAQLQTALDDVYVNYSEGPISGAQQLQDLGFITASNFDQLVGVPTGLISGASAGVTQGTIKINGNEVNVGGLQSNSSPTFLNVTVDNNLTVKGTVTAFQTDNVNIEDQFLLINSGAIGDGVDNDKDGGIIVDAGAGKGALLMYDAGGSAWGFVGSVDPANNGVDYNEISTDGSPVNPDVYVATVNSNGDGNGVAPTAAPAYGTGDTQKGQMHINTSDSTIWIYV